AILPPRTPTSPGPRPAWFTTSPPRTIRSNVSGICRLRGAVGGRQQLFRRPRDGLHRQVHHVTERLAETGVNRADLFVGARAPRHPGVLAPGPIELLVGGAEEAERRYARRGGQVHGAGVVADEQARPLQAGVGGEQVGVFREVDELV